MASGEISDPPTLPDWNSHSETVDGPAAMVEDAKDPEVLYADLEPLDHQDEEELVAMEGGQERDGEVAELGPDQEIGAEDMDSEESES
ncbi:hypothetical protein NL676_010553 [Syzygium grande]|nr:hypothetical protein NL676_010553 [Syzygium grande]